MSTTTPQHAEAVEALAPETRRITAGGKPYEVRRLETRQVWPVLRAGLPIIEGLVALVPASSPGAGSPLGGAARTDQALDATKPQTLDSLLGPEVAAFIRLMAEHGERITEIVAVALDEKISTVGRFEPQDTYLALRAIIEVNRDFFQTRVAPLLGLDPSSPGMAALAGAVTEAVRGSPTIGAGATPSSC